MRIIRKSELVEGHWRNGMGVSWDIATDLSGITGGDFGWRLAVARIDADVPFSRYEGVDRIFTLISGNGLDLEFEGLDTISVPQVFIPHFFSCEVQAFCRLRDGTCFALNLFIRRGHWTAAVDIISSNAEISHPGSVLLFVLEGSIAADGEPLSAGDAVLTSECVSISAASAKAYVARLTSG